MKKNRLIPVICMVFLFGLISFSVKPLSRENKPKVVVVLKALDSQYWKIFKAGAEKAFDDYDIDGEVIGPQSPNNIPEQARLLKRVLKQNPDALIVSPITPSTVIPIFEDYKKKKIPVLVADTDAGWKDQTAYIGTDNPVLGRKAGELLASMLQPGDKVALITPNLNEALFNIRINAARETLEAAGIKTVLGLDGDEGANQKVTAMENILQPDTDTKGVFAVHDISALNALKVIKKNGLKIPVVGTDGIIDMVSQIKNGTLTGTVAQNPYDMGYLSVANASKVIKGEKINSKIDSGVDVITEDNAKEKLDFLEKILKEK